MNEIAKVEQARGHGERLEKIERRFRRWREGRKAGERIPVALWAAAVGLAQEHGLHRIALELRVDFNGLKKRLERAGGAAQGGQVEARFVELFAAPASTAAGRCECAVELENGRGAKMRVELNGNGLVGLAGVCNAFWSAA